ncbi:MAG: hypothetical protein ACK5O7_04730 [Holosporales bacterium]
MLFKSGRIVASLAAALCLGVSWGWSSEISEAAHVKEFEGCKRRLKEVNEVFCDHLARKYLTALDSLSSAPDLSLEQLLTVYSNLKASYYDRLYSMLMSAQPKNSALKDWATCNYDKLKANQDFDYHYKGLKGKASQLVVGSEAYHATLQALMQRIRIIEVRIGLEKALYDWAEKPEMLISPLFCKFDAPKSQSDLVKVYDYMRTTQKIIDRSKAHFSDYIATIPAFSDYLKKNVARLMPEFNAPSGEIQGANIAHLLGDYEKNWPLPQAMSQARLVQQALKASMQHGEQGFESFQKLMKTFGYDTNAYETIKEPLAQCYRLLRVKLYQSEVLMHLLQYYSASPRTSPLPGWNQAYECEGVDIASLALLLRDFRGYHQALTQEGTPSFLFDNLDSSWCAQAPALVNGKIILREVSELKLSSAQKLVISGELGVEELFVEQLSFDQYPHVIKSLIKRFFIKSAQFWLLKEAAAPIQSYITYNPTTELPPLRAALDKKAPKFAKATNNTIRQQTLQALRDVYLELKTQLNTVLEPQVPLLSNKQFHVYIHTNGQPQAVWNFVKDADLRIKVEPKESSLNDASHPSGLYSLRRLWDYLALPFEKRSVSGKEQPTESEYVIALKKMPRKIAALSLMLKKLGINTQDLQKLFDTRLKAVKKAYEDSQKASQNAWVFDNIEDKKPSKIEENKSSSQKAKTKKKNKKKSANTKLNSPQPNVQQAMTSTSPSTEAEKAELKDIKPSKDTITVQLGRHQITLPAPQTQSVDERKLEDERWEEPSHSLLDKEKPVQQTAKPEVIPPAKKQDVVLPLRWLDKTKNVPGHTTTSVEKDKTTTPAASLEGQSQQVIDTSSQADQGEVEAIPLDTKVSMSGDSVAKSQKRKKKKNKVKAVTPTVTDLPQAEVKNEAELAEPASEILQQEEKIAEPVVPSELLQLMSAESLIKDDPMNSAKESRSDQNLTEPAASAEPTLKPTTAAIAPSEQGQDNDTIERMRSEINTFKNMLQSRLDAIMHLQQALADRDMMMAQFSEQNRLLHGELLAVRGELEDLNSAHTAIVDTALHVTGMSANEFRAALQLRKREKLARAAPNASKGFTGQHPIKILSRNDKDGDRGSANTPQKD